MISAQVQAIPTMKNPRGTFLRVLSNQDLINMEKADQEKEKALREQQKPPMLALAAHIKTAWQAALRAKTSGVSGQGTDIQERLLRCVRQRSGYYDPEQLARIKKFGGSEVYMMLTNVKFRAAASWIRDIMIPPGEKPWSIDPTPVPELPEAVEVEIIDQVTYETAQVMMVNGINAVSTEEIAERVQEVRDKVQQERVERSTEATNRFETSGREWGQVFIRPNWLCEE